MTVDGRGEVQRFAQSVIGAFLLSAGEKARAAEFGEAAQRFLGSERCAELVDQFVRSLAQLVATELNHERRSNPFCRLLCHPLTDLLVSGALPRTMLGNYFSFLHLVLGDAQEEITGQCQAVIDEIKPDPHFSWDMFYDDSRVKLLLWTVLMRIVDTFKRFDARRDWFIALMQNRPQAVSLGANAFMPIAHHGEDEPALFGQNEFVLMFSALFRPLLDLPPRDEAAFTQHFGAPPARLVQPLVEKLG